MRQVHALILSERQRPDVIAELVEALIVGCRQELLPRVKLKFAECLGELGAVDPDRLRYVLPIGGDMGVGVVCSEATARLLT